MQQYAIWSLVALLSIIVVSSALAIISGLIGSERSQQRPYGASDVFVGMLMILLVVIIVIGW